MTSPDSVLKEGERATLVERLNAAFAAGGIPTEEYEHHLDTLFRAGTLGEVAPVVRVLPPVATHATPAIVPVGEGRPGELPDLRSPFDPAARSRALVVGGAAAGLLVVILVSLVLGGLLF